jgi:hypothetical protein
VITVVEAWVLRQGLGGASVADGPGLGDEGFGLFSQVVAESDCGQELLRPPRGMGSFSFLADWGADGAHLILLCA